jgi:hypothetical protein
MRQALKPIAGYVLAYVIYVIAAVASVEMPRGADFTVALVGLAVWLNMVIGYYSLRGTL